MAPLIILWDLEPEEARERERVQYADSLRLYLYVCKMDTWQKQKAFQCCFYQVKMVLFDRV